MCQPRRIRIEVNNWKRESNSVLDYFVLFWSFHLKFHFNLNIWCRLKENISLCRRKVDIVNSTNVNLNTATGRLYGITNVEKLTHNQFCDIKMKSWVDWRKKLMPSLRTVDQLNSLAQKMLYGNGCILRGRPMSQWKHQWYKKKHDK